MHRLDGGDRRHAGARAPGQEFLRGAGIGPARVRVTDVSREELAHAGALTGGGDQRRQRGRGNRSELVHGYRTLWRL
jgi:hypothetical protein